MKKTAFGFGPPPGQPVPGQPHIGFGPPPGQPVQGQHHIGFGPPPGQHHIGFGPASPPRAPVMTQDLTFAEQAKRALPTAQALKRPTDIVMNRPISGQAGKEVFHHMMTTKNPSVAHVRADMLASKLLDPMKRLGNMIPKAIKVGYLRGKEAAMQRYLGTY